MVWRSLSRLAALRIGSARNIQLGCTERSTQTRARIPADLTQASDTWGKVTGGSGEFLIMFCIRKPNQDIAKFWPNQCQQFVKINVNQWKSGLAAWQIACNDRLTAALLWRKSRLVDKFAAPKLFFSFSWNACRRRIGGGSRKLGVWQCGANNKNTSPRVRNA
jgi:hypothetical protein